MNFFKKHRERIIRKELLLEVTIFVLSVGSFVIFRDYNLLITCILVVLYIIANRFWHKKHDHIFFIVGAVVGTLAELISTHYGVWGYANPTILNIPLWLPIAWGLAVVLAARISETFVKIEKR